MGSSRADLHIHTTCSDGTATPEQVARILSSSLLAVAAVTDHDTVDGALRVREALAGRGPEIVIGTEVSSADGHILALFVDRSFPAGRSARETVELIHERGGLAIAAHPYFPIESLGDLAACLPFDAIEIANGTVLGELGNLRARWRLARRARAVVGGSDAHVAVAVGHVQTLFPGRTAADLRVAIERGETKPAFAWGRHLRIAPALAAAQTRSLVRDFIQHRTEPLRA
jgi:predicted metal-dependent phosphoesterase TrpH